jgi:hypothetical protein
MCLSAFPGWPGLVLSGSQDQTVCSWQPHHEPSQGPAALVTSLTDAADEAAASLGDATGESAAASTSDLAAATEALSAGGDADVASTTPQPEVLSTQQQQQEQQHSKSQPAAASSKKQPRQFLLPKAKSFLPELPDTSGSLALQLQAQLDVVALAEALYPPAAASGSSPLLDAGVMRALLVGSGADSDAAVAAASATAAHSAGGSSVAGAYKQQLSATIGSDYRAGSWLPTMTADVPELLRQHNASSGSAVRGASAGRSSSSGGRQRGTGSGAHSSGTQQQQQLSDSQLGMLQFIAGDVAGFLQTAVAADAVTPDVVALSAAGGAPAWGAAARLAAAKLAAGGDSHAAALHLAAGESAEAAAALLLSRPAS